MLLKATLVVPEKLLPKMVTMVPSGPVVGEKEVMMGGAVMEKLVALTPVPSGVVTLMGPEEAPLGTVAEIWVSETKVEEVGVPLKATAELTVKLLPVIVTLVPSGPVVGEKEATMGGLDPVESVSTINSGGFALCIEL